ncbi:MAG: patatin-like phospholipase family protein, partial [Verrucomicrobiae bacterium]|nr:patatin-like phospholipase family protein [Verrucomicrobiae bacterium]
MSTTHSSADPPQAAPLSLGQRLRQVAGKIWHLLHWPHQPQPEPQKPSPEKPLPETELGEEDGSVRVIAFSSGAADAIFEFGLIHALVFSEAKRPHIVIGTSAGSVFAAALADVLQAGDSQPGSSPYLARIARFRALLNKVQEAPSNFAGAALPDLTEISARAGLWPLSLPTQNEGEKRGREKIALTRFGLIQLFNGMLSLRLKIGELTRILRLQLEVQRVGEWRLPHHNSQFLNALGCVGGFLIRFVWRTCLLLRIWGRLLGPLFRDAPLWARCGLGLAQEADSERAETENRYRRFLGLNILIPSRLRHAIDILFERWRTRFVNGILWILSYPLVLVFWAFAPVLVSVWLILRGTRWLARQDWSCWVFRVCLFAGLFMIWNGAFALEQHFLGKHLKQAPQFHTNPFGALLEWLQSADYSDWVYFALASVLFMAMTALVPYPLIRCLSLVKSRSRRPSSSLAASMFLALLTSIVAVIIMAMASISVAPQVIWEFSMLSQTVKALRDWFVQWPITDWILTSFGIGFCWGLWGLWLALLISLYISFDAKISLSGRFLRAYSLQEDLLTTEMLRRLLIHAFDPGYFGQPDFAGAINQALGGQNPAQISQESKRKLHDWLWPGGATEIAAHPLLVVPLAADVKTGQLRLLEPHLPVVDALCASCALTPFFKAQKLDLHDGGHHLIDASNVAVEPLKPAIDLLKRLHLHSVAHTEGSAPGGPFAKLRLRTNTKYVEICVISPYPSHRLLEEERAQLRQDMPSESKPETNRTPRPQETGAPLGSVSGSSDQTGRCPPGWLHRLTDILALQAAHAAKDERCLMVLHNAAVGIALGKKPSPFYWSGPPDAEPEAKATKADDWHLYAHLRPIEPDQPLHLLTALVRCQNEAERRDRVTQAIADGCQASLKALFPDKIKEIGATKHGLDACHRLMRLVRPGGSSTFSVDDLTDLPSLAGKLKQPKREFDRWLAGQLSPATQGALAAYPGKGSDSSQIQQSLLQDINNILQGDSIYEGQRFARIALRDKTETLKSQNPRGSDLQRLNRLLIEDAYPQEVSGIPPEASHPGLTEICEQCRFKREPRLGWFGVVPALDATKTEKAPAAATGVPPASSEKPPTPSESKSSSLVHLPDWGQSTTKRNRAPDPMTLEKSCWPKRKPTDPKSKDAVDRPMVSLVFSGGVFRGVFQIGVLNALNFAKIQPDLVAGASVGSIVAALSARIFAEGDADLRHHRMALVAGTFLTIDRLVLTDRFADFIRRFTLRAGAANFSFCDGDTLFRRYDRRSWNRLTARSRRVLAGLQRLAYLDPLELLDLLGVNDHQKRGKVGDRLLFYAQEFLNRAGIGNEILGAEPLETLIREHVLDGDLNKGAT